MLKFLRLYPANAGNNMNAIVLELIVIATVAVAVGGTTYVVLTLLEVIHKE